MQYQGGVTPLANGSVERNKRPAEDDDKTSELLQREAFSSMETKVPTPPGAQADQRIMAHMLGLDIPGVQASTSYFPGYEWWPSIPVQQSAAANYHHHAPAHSLQTQAHAGQHPEAQPRMAGGVPPMVPGGAQAPQQGAHTPMQHSWMATSPVRGYPPYENGMNGYHQYGR